MLGSIKCVSIRVVYLGTARLLLGRSEERLDFSADPTVAEIYRRIATIHGRLIAQECSNKLWIVDSPTSCQPAYLKDIQDATDIVPNGSTVTIVSKVTGG